MINRETIWNETYRRDFLRIEGACIEVFTAIHHYTGMGAQSRLDLCSELNLNAKQGAAELIVNARMTPDQMEELAGYLSEAAVRVRELQSRLEADEAETRQAAEEAIKLAKEGA